MSDLRTALKCDDKDVIEKKTEALGQASAGIAQRAYAANAGAGAGAARCRRRGGRGGAESAAAARAEAARPSERGRRGCGSSKKCKDKGTQGPCAYERDAV